MEKILPYLEQLANKLGVAVNHLWEVLIKKSLTEGYISVIMAVIWIIVVIVLIKTLPLLQKHLNNTYKELKEERTKNCTGYDDYYAVSGFKEDFCELLKNTISTLIYILIAILIFIIVSDLKFGIRCLINPEYYALLKILELLK